MSAGSLKRHSGRLASRAPFHRCRAVWRGRGGELRCWYSELDDAQVSKRKNDDDKNDHPGNDAASSTSHSRFSCDWQEHSIGVPGASWWRIASHRGHW